MSAKLLSDRKRVDGDWVTQFIVTCQECHLEPMRGLTYDGAVNMMDTHNGIHHGKECEFCHRPAFLVLGQQHNEWQLRDTREGIVVCDERNGHFTCADCWLTGTLDNKLEQANVKLAELVKGLDAEDTLRFWTWVEMHADQMKEDSVPRCGHCGAELHQVPGGSGPVWVDEQGFRACLTVNHGTMRAHEPESNDERDHRVKSLDDMMDFDHIIRVHADGTVTDANDVNGPDLHEGELDRSGWTLMTGYSGQEGYSGPIMHASEFIGEGCTMERDILAKPGLYVTLVNYPWDNTEPDGWAVAYREDA